MPDSGRRPGADLSLVIAHDAQSGPGGPLRVAFEGEINERSDFTTLRSRLPELKVELRLVLERVSAINSYGMRLWAEFLSQVPREIPIILERCSPTVIDYVNMMHVLKTRCRVESLFAPYYCNRCRRERTVLLSAALDLKSISGGEPPARPCSECGEPMAFDEVPDQYFSFLG
jgi:hypothetical protein